MNSNPTNIDGADSSAANKCRKWFALVRAPQSGLVVCCGAFLGLVLGLSLTQLLLKQFGVLFTCSGLMLLFLGPLLWAFSRKETSDTNGKKQRQTHSLDQTWVISFWCVCSMVLLLIATV